MTPFAPHLANTLDVEKQRFANKWLFPWHNINIPGRTVEVEDFRGGRFSVGGIQFQGQIQTLYWQAIAQYLSTKAHESFQRLKDDVQTYPEEKRRASIEETGILLMQFAAGILALATDTDRRVRGRGFPEKVPNYDVSPLRSRINSDISRLRDSYNGLLSPSAAKTARPGDLGTHRRLAAILFADVVGYSHLMQADEAGTLAEFKARRAEILEPLATSYEGRVVKFMGDGVFVEFASAVNAVKCAMELQQRMAQANSNLLEGQKIKLRVGINLGEVIVEGSDLYGDGVNIAARLEEIGRASCRERV
jgi:hypothetical protein